MVEFCKSCKSSLPTGDLTIAKGKKFTSHDFVCPSCGKLAHPPAKKPRKSPEPSPGKDILISGGESRVE